MHLEWSIAYLGENGSSIECLVNADGVGISLADSSSSCVEERERLKRQCHHSTASSSDLGVLIIHQMLLLAIQTNCVEKKKKSTERDPGEVRS